MGPKNQSRPQISSSSSSRGRKEEGTKHALIEEQMDILPPISGTFPVTSCSICQGVEDDDLTILCDGANCQKEAHLYCLQPPLFHVPEGEWYCDTCDPIGSTKHLEKYFHEHDEFYRSSVSYDHFLSFLPQRYFSIDSSTQVFNPFYLSLLKPEQEDSEH